MRTIFLFSLLTLILTGCNLTKGMGPSGLVQNGCGNHCTSRDYYLPGKGVWADDKPVDKSIFDIFINIFTYYNVISILTFMIIQIMYYHN